MIDRAALLADLQALLKRLEADLLERSESNEVPDVGRTLRTEYKRAKDAERTAANYEDWRSDAITQAAAAWVLSCVFVRFLEDNQLIDPPKIAGPKERLQRARDEHEIYFREHPTETDREYLLTVFDELAELPGAKDVFGEHNPIRELPNWLSGDAAGEMLRFFQKIDADTGDLVHDFADQDWDTRFLGDLYQDLSEAARKKYALLQTPEFVEDFILDRTLEPALDEFGLDAPPVTNRQGNPITEPGFRMIDPACGSGHFLLGAFPRIVAHWQKREPGSKIRDLVQKTLDCIHGVDVNPYAVAIGRFRLLLMALKSCDISRLADSPQFHFNLACGDSLLHAPLLGGQQVFDWELTSEDVECDHAYQSEHLAELKRMLQPGIYHAVVANPPYITPKDKLLNKRYRKRFESCHRQYSLAVPFMEHIFRLGIAGGFNGQITANSFMKREFGKKLIEQFLPDVDLRYVIDTSGAYIPGHGTPTVILLGRHQRPVADTIRTVLGIRGEPSTPDDPAQGMVWSSILAQVDNPTSQSQFVSVIDSSRKLFSKHPWSIGGGGAAELKVALESRTDVRLGDSCTAIGFVCITKADDFFAQPREVFRRATLESGNIRPFGIGEQVRDWHFSTDQAVIFPYDDQIGTIPLDGVPCLSRYYWPYRTELGNRKVFGGHSYFDAGKPWYEYGQIPVERARVPLSIVFAFVSTHNHFVLDRGGNVFKQSAPVIKLPPEAGEDDHVALLGVLNSSTACFWMKQVFHNKGDSTDQHGARTTGEVEFNSYEFAGTGLRDFPLPENRPMRLTRQLDALAKQLSATTPSEVLTRSQRGTVDDRMANSGISVSLRESIAAAHERYNTLRGLMIFLQEELDWSCYRLFGLIDEDLTYAGDPFPLEFGERSFEILLAREVAQRNVPATTWFSRHNAQAVTASPEHWPTDYATLHHRRDEVQKENSSIGLIEQPEYKRRWHAEPWELQLERALRSELLERLESHFDFDGRMNDEGNPTAKLDICLTTVAALADVARQDPQFMEVGEVYRDDRAFDVQRLVDELVQAENVPLLPVLRYKPAGLRKRQEWEKTWELQRREDALDTRTELPKDDPQYLAEDQAADLKRRDIGDIPVPPKYKSSDFISSGGARYWALRGKLDVPKERWVSFPHCEGPDGTLVIAWAGYDHLQLVRAISEYYVDIQQRLGGGDDPRLVPLLACVIELLPWLKQWHHHIDPDYNQRMDEFFEGFVTEEAKALNKTIDEVRAWQPPKKAGGRKRKKAGT